MIRTLTLAVLGTILVSGCSASDDSGDEPPPSTQAPTPISPEAVVDVENQPGEGEYVGALDDVTEQACAPEGSAWRASGTVTNPTLTESNYRIFVSFLDSAGETVGLIEQDLDAVPPEESAEYSVDLDSSAVGLRCVLRVERRTD